MCNNTCCKVIVMLNRARSIDDEVLNNYFVVNGAVCICATATNRSEETTAVKATVLKFDGWSQYHTLDAIALTIEVTEELMSTGTNRLVSVGYTTKVDVIVQFDFHGAMELLVNHCREPFYVLNSREMIETVFFGRLIVLDAIEGIALTVNANVVLTHYVCISAAAISVAICNTALGVACTVEVCNLIYSGTGDWQGNGVGIGEILSERMCIGISIGSQVRTQCRIQQVANLAAVQGVSCVVGWLFALISAIIFGGKSVVAVSNRAVRTAEELSTIS